MHRLRHIWWHIAGFDGKPLISIEGLLTFHFTAPPVFADRDKKTGALRTERPNLACLGLDSVRAVGHMHAIRLVTALIRIA